MKTGIEIVTGFLSSGKTSMINIILREDIDKNKKIVIIQCEMGQKEINEKYINENIIIEKIPKGNSLEEMYMKQIVDKYSPDKIIIEQNGMETIEELLNQLDTKSMRKCTRIERIINIIDCRQFNMLMGILGNNLINKIAIVI
ncbi:GTP-binding protein [Tissierella sp. P1]|uniref:GTP-binding protein n=1 Tax=Tissierella sp. P1 TaxID=1280483 RepID=UPI001303ADA0|nr:GTP-binding protein [Tissierella sp. P1]